MRDEETMEKESAINMSYSKLDYELTNTNRFLFKLPDVIKWLSSLGCNANLSRYSHYLSHIKNVTFDRSNNNKDIDLDKLFQFGNLSLLEVVNIVMIYEHFKDEKSDGFIKRIKKVVTGKDFFEGDNEDQGRDILYELMIAHWFHEKGYSIDFNQLTDVVVQKGETDFYIECKRLKSANNYEGNIKKGCKQLVLRGKANSFKLVFVDIYNCISSEIPSYEYSSIFEMKQRVRDAMNKFFIIPNQKITDKIVDVYNDVDGIVFTALCCLWLSNITPQCFFELTVQANPKMDYSRYKQLAMLLQR